MQRAPRSHLALAVLTILVLAGLGWFQLDGLQVTSPLPAVARLPPAVVSPSVAAQTASPSEAPLPAKVAAVQAASPSVAALPSAAASALAAQLDSAPTSWENPFQAEHWDAPGWTLSRSGMQPAGPDSAEARFRRPYRHLTLNCLLEPLQEPAGPFEIRLASPEIQRELTFRIDAGRVTIIDNVAGESRKLIDRAVNLQPPGKLDQGPTTMTRASRLRFVATGNRIVVSWNGPIIARCDQPAAYSDQSLIWSLRAGPDAFLVRALRVEGE